MRVSYTKEMRKDAKDHAEGLVTIDVVSKNGGRFTMQARVNVEELKKVRDFGIGLTTERTGGI